MANVPETIAAQSQLAVERPSSRLLSIRARLNREPAASPAEMERGGAILPSRTVRQVLAKTWGWS